jgi:hypothetical protein
MGRRIRSISSKLFIIFWHNKKIKDILIFRYRADKENLEVYYEAPGEESVESRLLRRVVRFANKKRFSARKLIRGLIWKWLEEKESDGGK